MVHLDDVAKRAGVSKNTASRVLNNRGYISEATRTKVMKAIEELNYYPNENARNLLRQRTGVVGLLVPSIINLHYAEIISSIETEISQRGLKLTLCSTEHNPKLEWSILQMFQGNRIDGLIALNRDLDAKDYNNLTFPIVSIDRWAGDDACHVSSDHHKGGTLAAKALIEAGCHSVMQVTYSSGFPKASWDERHEVFEKIMIEHGIPCYTYVTNLVPKSTALDKHRSIIREQLERYPDVDGFFSSDLWAVSALKEAIKLGRKVPQDLKIVGYDDTILTEITTPPITSIRQHADKIGSAAVQLLDSMINDRVKGQKIILDVELIERESTLPD